MNRLIDDYLRVAIGEASPVVSLNPVCLPAPKRGQPLEMRISAPVAGDNLPIVLLSHGHGPSLYLSSKDGYAPLANFYAAHGFVVIQPTHANSKVAGLGSDASGAPFFWRSRVEDMMLILDQLDEIEAQFPAIKGRLNADKVTVVGHSLGAQTAGILLGALLTDTNDPDSINVSMIDHRIKAGVLLAPPGNGGDSLSEFARLNYTSLNPDYSQMTTPTLVVVGDQDVNPHLTVRGAEWHTDAYYFGPGCNALLTLNGGKHGLGGVAGFDAKETDDEDPNRLALTQKLSLAYLVSSLYPDDPSWGLACKMVATDAKEAGRIDLK